MDKSSALRYPAIAGLLAGLLSGFVFALALAMQGLLPLLSSLGLTSVPLGVVGYVLLGSVAGIGSGLLFWRAAITPGASLMWGMAYALLWWIAGFLMLFPFLQGQRPGWTVEVARAAFPLLLGHLVAYGAVFSLTYRFLFTALAGRRQPGEVRRLAGTALRALILGGLAGLLGGWVFGAWMARVGFFPLVAGLVGSDSAMVGRALHLVISIVIGVTYGLLFQRDICGTGTSIAWGVAYGLIWWILGPLTIMPLWLGQGPQWSLEAARAAFPSLVGHLVYGVVLGVTYSVMERFWRLLFTEADPLNREPEGPGTRSLRALGMGMLASIIGGLVFTVVMVRTGALPQVASLVGASTPTAGFAVHMAISAILGATYGLLFRRESTTYGAGLVWGLVYGFVWWLLGPLTLMPVFLGAEVQWSLAAALAAYPSLIGHLAYGGALALAYQLLLRRYDPLLLLEQARVLRFGLRRSPTSGGRVFASAAPALWVLVLVMGVVLPLILA